MTPITSKNLHRHELIGMNVEIVAASDKNRLGLKGTVCDETKHLLVIVPDGTKGDSKQVAVPKKDCTFRFTLSNGKLVDIEGLLLDTKSENRIKNVIRKRW